MFSESKKLFKIFSLVEIVISIWTGLAILIGISLSPWFNWINNAISDLGVSNVAILFNSSLILCGIISTIFCFIYVFFEKTNKIGAVGIIFLMMASIWLIGIGIFTEAFPPFHYIFSVLFFVFVLFSSLCLGVRFILDKKYRYFGIYCFLIFIIGTTAWALPIWVGVAIPEAITIYPTIILAILLSIRLYIEN